MNAQAQILSHPKCGTPSKSYTYRDAAGAAVMIANRFDKPDGSKFFMPFDPVAQVWKAPQHRPLYNLDRILAADPSEVVIFVEGEKCADALTALGFVATTTYGGANAAAKSDHLPLKSRKVVIWPDADLAGYTYAKDVKTMLLQSNAQDAMVLDIEAVFASKTMKKHENARIYTDNSCKFVTDQHAKEAMENTAFASNSMKNATLPKGWDAADAIAEGWTKADIADLIATSLPAPAPDEIAAPKEAASLDGMELWHTPQQEAYASILVGDHVENWALSSSHFRNFLAYQHYQAEGKMLSQTALEDKRRTLEGEARFGGDTHQVSTRIGSLDGSIYLDLCNDAWGAVRIGADGWECLSRPPIRFERSGSAAALPTPKQQGADIDVLRPYLNVASETDFRLLVAWLIGALQPKGPYPILILTGEQGSAKSTTAKVLRSLIDPANPIARSAPHSEQDLVIAARHNHILAFDNLSYIKPNLADALCRIATGGGFGTRKLHTNSEEVLFDATRPVLLNGIPDLASRPDLADRSIIITLPVIAETERKFERDFWQTFERDAPRILGALLNAASDALRRLPSTDLHERPRMADFARWATAAEMSLGWPEGAFMQAYNTNRSVVDAAALEGNPVAEAVHTLVMEQGTWRGTASGLIMTLRNLYPQLTDDAQTFPRSANKLSSELRRVHPILRRQGVTISRTREGKSGKRYIELKYA